jgi:hypothetical protein
MSIVKLTVYVELEEPMGTPINACVKIEEGLMPFKLFGSILKLFSGAYLKPAEYFINKTTPVFIQDCEPERLNLNDVLNAYQFWFIKKGETDPSNVYCFKTTSISGRTWLERNSLEILFSENICYKTGPLKWWINQTKQKAGE